MAELATVTIDVKNFNEVKEYFEKYRWHDLTKNPKDLPAEDCRVLIAYMLRNGNWCYDIADFAIDMDFDECWGMSGFYNYDSEYGYYPVYVDGWKYIEPLEV